MNSVKIVNIHSPNRAHRAIRGIPDRDEILQTNRRGE